jgi:hypothetical protein
MLATAAHRTKLNYSSVLYHRWLAAFEGSAARRTRPMVKGSIPVIRLSGSTLASLGFSNAFF